MVCLEQGCIGDSILFPPTESNSSMKITQGAFAFASPDKRKIAEGALNHTKEQGVYQVVQHSIVTVILEL